MADYPGTTFTPTTKNTGDTIAGSHVNALQAEVTAIEAALLNSGLAHHLLFVDATYDIGASGATRPRHLYLSGSVVSGEWNAGAVRSALGIFTTIGVGITPSASWWSGDAPVQVGGTGSIWSAASTGAGNAVIIGHNVIETATVFQYIASASDEASYYQQINGTHAWYTAPAGTAGNTITFTGQMLLSNAGVLTITQLASGNLTSASGVITSSSDERLKDILGPLDYGLAEVLALKPIRYHWNAASGIPTEPEYGGFGAEQVEQFMPLAVSYGKDGMRGLHDRVILGGVVNGLREVHARLLALEAR